MFYIVEGKGLKIIIQAKIVGQQKGGESFGQKLQICLLLPPPLHPEAPVDAPGLAALPALSSSPASALREQGVQLGDFF